MSFSRGMKRIAMAPAALLFALAILSACPPKPPSPLVNVVMPGTEPMLPRALAPGFQLKPVEHYGPDTLWKKINGAADLFLSYGFRELTAAEYARPNARLSEIEVSIYDMGDDLNALGVYLAEKSEGAEIVPIGWEGYQSGGVFFHKGPYYIKIVDLSEAGSLGPLTREIARHIDERILVKRRPIAELELFPTGGLVPGSTTYIHTDAMGHAFLERVFKADYEIDGKTVTLFFKRDPDPNALLAKYRDYGKEFGKVEREWRAEDIQLMTIRAFDNPEMIFAKDNIFGGVAGYPNELVAFDLIRALLANVEKVK